MTNHPLPTRGDKVPVSKAALLARINRKLAHDGLRLCATRSADMRFNFGDFFILDWHRNVIKDWRANPEELARELGVLADFESAPDFSA